MTEPSIDPVVFDRALEEIAAGAQERDSDPGFPSEAFSALDKAGALSFTFSGDGRRLAAYAQEWDAVRAVARSDGSVGRIFDGHLNGVERLALLAPDELRAALREGMLLGVWGADPRPAEGEPATLYEEAGRFVLSGSKTFCSGAGGVDRALVMVRTEAEGPPALVYVDPAVSAGIDRTWFAASGLRSSESHMVTFHETPVITVLGEPGELARNPWFSRDAIRTAASWAGMADLAAERALDVLAPRADDDLAALAAGRILTSRARIDLWIEKAARIAGEDASGPAIEFSIELRDEISGAAHAILDEAARACGSHPFATGDPLDRARRDLTLFLLQHRLDPLVARMGRDRLAGGGT